MGFRTGVLIGVLATAVVALGVAVVVLASDDSGDGTNETETTAQTTSDVLGGPCKFESMGGEVEIELSSEEIGCSQARAVYSAYKEAVRSGDAGIGESSDVGGWGCEEFPLSEYPLIVRCRQGGDRFVVLGTAPAPHTNQGPPPTSGTGELTFFQTPSRNISCAMEVDSVRCDIRKRDWSPPPKPGDCMLDWGNAIRLERSGSTFLCAGDTTANRSNPVLRYGESAAVGSFLCESQEQNLLCVNVRTQHGFRLSIQRVDLF